jgi:hypothetical protein
MLLWTGLNRIKCLILQVMIIIQRYVAIVKEITYIAYYTNGTVSGGANNGGDDIVVFKLDKNGGLL